MDFLAVLESYVEAVLQLVTQAYQQAPVLLVALSVVLLIPFLMMTGWLMRLRWPASGGAMTKRILSTEHRKSSAPELTGRSVMPEAPPRPMPATIERLSGDNTIETYPFGSLEMLRLGREDDNDICFEDATVHRYHAVIRRTTDAGYIISDISQHNGNGVFINGRRTREASLKDGDEIGLGKAKFVFRSSNAEAMIN